VIAKEEVLKKDFNYFAVQTAATGNGLTASVLFIWK
jgi:hypothetical protein